MKLYHISDNPNIEIFETRPSNDSWQNLTKSYVWAISDEMVQNYYFPRNCPRVCWMIGVDTPEENKEKFQEFAPYRGVIFVEKAWKEDIENCTLYRYEFDNTNFYPIDYSAGYYISEKAEKPINKEVLTGLTSLLEESKVLLKYVDDLEKYRIEGVTRKYRFSNIRMKFMNKKKK